MEHVPRLERTALVVDDDVFVVSALAELLEDDGFDVQTATNGFSAMRHAAASRFALILLDVALPERSGTEILKDLRSDPATRDVAIVLITGFAERLTDTELASADGVVPKPFDVEELLETIQHALQRAATRRADVAPVAPTSHREADLRARRSAAARRTRGRR